MLFGKIWPLVLAIPATLLVYNLFVNKQKEYDSSVVELNKIHQRELEKISVLREEERKHHEENIKRLQDSLALVQLQYEKANKKLDEKQKKQVEKIVKKYSNDTKGLAEELSKMTGYKVILPEN